MIRLSLGPLLACALHLGAQDGGTPNRRALLSHRRFVAEVPVGSMHGYLPDVRATRAALFP